MWPVLPHQKQVPIVPPFLLNRSIAAASLALVSGPPSSLHALIQYSNPLLLYGVIAALHSLVHCSNTNCLINGMAVSGSSNIFPATSITLATKSEKDSVDP